MAGCASARTPNSVLIFTLDNLQSDNWAVWFGEAEFVGGVCPGNNRSAGKNKVSKITKGNRWLGAALTECAWGVSRKKDCFLKEKFWRLATKKQRKPPAIMALAHTVLVLSYQVLKTGQPYQERELPVLDEKQKNRIIWHHVKRLGKLGIRVRSLDLRKHLTGKGAKENKEVVSKN